MTGWKSMGSDATNDAKVLPGRLIDGRLIAEKHGDDTSRGMRSSFYRVPFFKAIGGFVRELMPDGTPSAVASLLGRSVP
jgi:hypothetical protein